MRWQEAIIVLKDIHEYEPFTREDADTDIFDNFGIKVIPTKTWNAFFNNHVLVDNNDGTFVCAEKPVKASKKSTSKSNTSGLNITKSNSQYYTKYYEKAVTSYVNNEEPVNTVNYKFTTEEIQIMNGLARTMAQFIGGNHAIHMGDKTSSASCDIEVDGKEYELKFGKSDGTFYNTSVSYFDKFGLIPFQQYMKDYGVLAFLETYFGSSVYDNKSPVSQDESSVFQENKAEYKKLKDLEGPARAAWVKYLFDFFNNNEEARNIFAEDMLSKHESGKHTPDFLLIHHYDTGEIIQYTKEEILNLSTEKFTIGGKYSLKFEGFKVVIAWQNGTGLNNPTVRVFIN